MEYFSKCMPPDNLLVTEGPQTSSSWSIWNMEDYRCQTIFSSDNLRYKCFVFVTVVGHCQSFMPSSIFIKFPSEGCFFTCRFFCLFHSCSVVTVKIWPAASTVYEQYSGLFITHSLSSGDMSEPARAFVSAALHTQTRTSHPAFLWGDIAHWSSKTYQMF